MWSHYIMNNSMKPHYLLILLGISAVLDAQSQRGYRRVLKDTQSTNDSQVVIREEATKPVDFPDMDSLSTLAMLDSIEDLHLSNSPTYKPNTDVAADTQYLSPDMEQSSVLSETEDMEMTSIDTEDLQSAPLQDVHVENFYFPLVGNEIEEEEVTDPLSFDESEEVELVENSAAIVEVESLEPVETDDSSIEEIGMIRAHLRDGSFDALKGYRFEHASSLGLYNDISNSIKLDQTESLRAQIALKEDEIASLRKELLDEENAFGEDKVKVLQAQIEELSSALKYYETANFVSIDSLNDAFFELGMPVLHSENAIQTLVERLHEYQEISKRVKEASLKQLQAEAELEILSQRSSAEQARVESLIAEIATIEAESKGKDEVLKILREDVSQARKDVETTRIKYDALKAKSDFEIARRDKQIDDYRQNLVKHLEHISELTGTLSQMAQQPDSGMLIQKGKGNAVPLAYDVPKLRQLLKNVLQTIHNYSYQSSPKYAAIEYVVSPQFLDKIKESYETALPQLSEHTVSQSFVLDEVTFKSGENHIEAVCQGLYTIVTNSSQISMFEYHSVVKLVPTKHNSYNPTGFIIQTINEKPPVLVKKNELTAGL